MLGTPFAAHASPLGTIRQLHSSPRMILSNGTAGWAYDPGSRQTGDGWLSLHRNENLAAQPFWKQVNIPGIVSASDLCTYPDSTAIALRTEIAKLYGVTADNIFLGNGSDEVLSILLARARRTRSRLITWEAGYRVFDLLGFRYGFNICRIPADQLFQLKASDLTGAQVVLDSPNAITSCSQYQTRLPELAQVCDGHLIWDNCYGDFENDSFPLPPCAKSVVVRSFSKFYGLAGLRIGYCIADASLVAELLSLKDVFNVDAVAQAFGLIALGHHASFRALAAEMGQVRHELTDRLRQLDFATTKSRTNFVFARHRTLPAKTICDRLRKERILVRHFDHPFVNDGIRITVPPRALFPQLLDALSLVTAP